MAMNADDRTAVAREAWSDYWQTGSTERAMPDDNPGTSELAAFWDRHAGALAGQPGGRVLDLACGGGFVSRRLRAALAARQSERQLLALDLAEPAVRQLYDASEGTVKGVVADASKLPFASGSFDAVVSQFGLEYAGHDALVGAAALLAPSGQLVLLVHHADGSIAQSCHDNATVIGAALDTGLLQGMMQLFTLLRRAGTRHSDFQASEEALQRAVQATEALMKRGPACAAMPRIQRLYQDVAQLYSRARAYEPAEALQWLQGTEEQLTRYLERMRGMVVAALSQDELAAISQGWVAQGLEIQEMDALLVNDRPLAWQIRAVRSAA